MTILLIIIIAAFGYLIIIRFNPFIFWNKGNLGLEDYVKWEQIFSGKIISRREISKIALRLPQCEKCFMSALNRNDLPKGTIIDPMYADYNVVAVKLNNEIILVCKKHKIQLKKIFYTLAPHQTAYFVW